MINHLGQMEFGTGGYCFKCGVAVWEHPRWWQLLWARIRGWA